MAVIDVKVPLLPALIDRSHPLETSTNRSAAFPTTKPRVHNEPVPDANRSDLGPRRAKRNGSVPQPLLGRQVRYCLPRPPSSHPTSG